MSGKKGQGVFALVDNEDFEIVSKFRWRLNGDGYVVANGKEGTKSRILRLHQLICPAPTGLATDHANRDTLDCRRSNLRLATKFQNNFNRRPQKNKRSKYKGVCWYYKKNYWHVRIYFEYTQIHIGSTRDEAEAGYLYDQVALQLFGDFAYLNTPFD